MGIKPEFLGSVFERFRQADASTARRFGGLGLGLAIVKQLVEMHGGAVRAESNGENQGATFIVSLPISVAKGFSRPTQEGDDDALHEAALSLDGVSILVVEDDSGARELLKLLLEAQGARVVTASGGREALAAIAAATPDLLVSDLGLPEMDGFELIERIRADKTSAALPAIAVTAFARPEDRQRVLLAGYQAHVAKPVGRTSCW